MSNWVGKAKRALLTRSVFSTIGRESHRAVPYRRAFAFESLEPRLVLAVAQASSIRHRLTAESSAAKLSSRRGGHGWQYNTRSAAMPPIAAITTRSSRTSATKSK